MPHDERDDQRTPENRLLLRLVAAAEGLRHQPGGGGAQEIEGGEDQVEEDRADREPGKQRRLAETADDGGIDQTEQRRRQEARASSARRSTGSAGW